MNLKLRKPTLGGMISVCHLVATALLLFVVERRNDLFGVSCDEILALGGLLLILSFPVMWPWVIFPRIDGAPTNEKDAFLELLVMLVFFAINSFVVGYGMAGLWKRRKTSRWPRTIFLGVLLLFIVVIFFLIIFPAQC